jgi:hypothetical protein
MRIKLLGLICLALTGCHGSIQIQCAGDHCEAKMYEVLDLVEGEMVNLEVIKHSDDLFNYLYDHNTYINLLSSSPKCGDEGCTEFDGNDIIIETAPPTQGEHQDCEAGNSSFPHELLHVALMMETGNPDADHSTPGMWFSADSVEVALYNLPLCD